MKSKIISFLSVVSIVLLPSSAWADWLHYRGPAYDGLSPEKLPVSLPPAGPKQLWKASLGIGTSAVTVSGNRAFSMGNVGGKDVVYCLEAATGKELWRHAYKQELDKRNFEGGPATTPTVDGNRLYSVSHQGDLFCLDVSTGQALWYKHYQQDFGGRRPQWGFAGSPTIEGNLVLCDVGGKGASTVALDKTSGKLVWKSGDDKAGYGSPVVATIGGRRTVVVFKAEHLVGLDLTNGRELWRSRWKTSYEVNAATPIVIGDKVFISSGYGAGCALIGINGNKATELWRNKNIKAHINTPVAVDGFVYGIDGQAGGSAPLVCLDLQSGNVKWEERNLSGGALIAADGKLIILTERGELLIGAASPAGFKAASRAQVLGGRCWVQPTLSAGRVFAKKQPGGTGLSATRALIFSRSAQLARSTIPNASLPFMRRHVFALVLLLGFAWGADAKPFTFIAIGCMPYGEESWPGFERLIAEINRQHPAFTVHCGDTKRGSDPASDRWLERIHAAFQAFNGPLIYTPGDNEWTDVMRESAGANDPVVWLAKIRERFFPDERSLGRAPITLSRQSADPRFGRFVENARWTKDGVVFATVHVVGSNNNHRLEVDGAVAEFTERDAANRAWVKAAFSEARGSQSAGVAFFIHADILAEDFGRPVSDSGHKKFIDTFEEEARIFAKPVLLVHADEHRYRLETGIRFERDRHRVMNITRLETFGAADLHAVRVIVDPTSPQLFLAGPLLVPGNDLPLLPRKASAP